MRPADRYAALVKQAALAGRPPTSAGGLHRGLALCDAIEGVRPTLSDTTGDDADGGGHRRGFYPWLARYAAALARHVDPSLPEVEGVMQTPGEPRDAQPSASEAGEVCVAAWRELAGVAARTLESSPTLEGLAATQSSDGPLFAFDRTGGDNPEPWWYHELVALHALTSYGHMASDEAAAAAARRAALFHHAETQPDHATGQPWAVHAFAIDVEMVPTADLLLLAAGVGKPGGIDVVSRLLLADAHVWLAGGPAKVRA